ncbi:MAG TPA: hypothetical protein VGR51_08175, partial [Thermoplasmata archaeon]|nr:hypothetical protein [Thermoplasmata archaeon]
MGLIATALAFAALGIVPMSVAGGRGDSDAIGVQTVSADVAMATDVHADVATGGCSNSPGPWITLTGELSFGGIGVTLIFRNNAKGTHEHTEDLTASVVVIPEGDTIQFAKQPPLGGVGGNPFIWIQFVDDDGNALSGEIFLGRCVQGFTSVDASFFTDALASANVEGGTCSNSPGPYITLSGEIRLSGINANLIFRNNDNPVGGPHEHSEDVTVSVVLLPEGETIQFAKQP